MMPSTSPGCDRERHVLERPEVLRRLGRPAARENSRLAPCGDHVAQRQIGVAALLMLDAIALAEPGHANGVAHECGQITSAKPRSVRRKYHNRRRA